MDVNSVRQVGAVRHKQDGSEQGPTSPVFDSLGLAFGLVRYRSSADGSAVAFGESLEAHFGFRPSDIDGSTGSWIDAVHAEDLVRYNIEVEAVRAGGKCDFEYRVMRPDGEIRTVRDRAIAVHDGGGRVVGVEGMLEDVTVHGRAEREVRELQERFAKVFEFSPISITITTLEGRYIAVNARFLEISGFRREDVVGRTAAEIDVKISPEDYAEFRARMAKDGFVRNMEMTVHYTDLRVRRVFVSSVIVDIGGMQCFLNAGTDLTDRILADDALRRRSDRIRELAGKLITLQEEERKRVARELHDDLSQQVAGIAIGLSNIKRKASAGKDVSELLEALRGRTVALSADVRNLSHRLHPAVLAHAGLVASLGSQCEEFERISDVETRFSAADVPDDVADDVGLCLYRIAQEALRNVARHARAKSVEVALSFDSGELAMQVRDDGVGFDASLASTREGLGLVSMEERARLVGGVLIVEAAPGEGTAVSVRVPLGRKME